MFPDRLNTVINRVLLLDPEVAGGIFSLAGSVIQVRLLNTPSVFTIVIHEDRLELAAEEPEVIHVRISGTPTALLAYLMAERNGSGTTAGELEISGDPGLAQAFTTQLKRLDIDLEERLAVIMGDTLARKSSRLLNGGIAVLRGIRNKLELDAGEYLNYEQESVADEDELQAFNDAVNNLRNDVERLKLRLSRLQQGSGN